MEVNEYSQPEKAAIYCAIAERRDVRTGFLPNDIADDLLRRLLLAAHQAPSVGLMQPWRFIVIRSRSVREEIFRDFQTAGSPAEINLKAFDIVNLRMAESAGLNLASFESVLG